MTVEELIEELQALPPTAMVEVCIDSEDEIPRKIIEANYDMGLVTILITKHQKPRR